MKKTLLLVLLTIGTLMAEEKVMNAIMQNVLLKDINKTLDEVSNFNKDLESNKELLVLQKDFKKLTNAWKKVETFYIAGSLNEDSIDLPRYIDVFHNLKENLQVQMQRVINSKDSLDEDMYKNSFKTINALEYVLFSGTLTKRKIAISKLIIKNIEVNLQDIKAVYINDSKRFLTEFKWTNDVIINMLIESSFKLRDWRVGDISGDSRKYKNSADNRRAEYFLSKNSKEAIKAIILTHKAVMNSEFYDFGDMLIENNFTLEVNLIRTKIEESLKNLDYIQNENFQNKDVKKLYKTLDELHRAYYLSLVNAVGVSTKILDADGD